MKLEKLSQEETRILEKETTPFSNIAQYLFLNEELATIWHDIIGWAHTYNINVNKPSHKWKKLIELFKCKPNYYIIYEYKNAIWGFNTDYGKIIIYNSLKGTGIQALPEFNKNKIKEFLTELRQVLCKNGIGEYSKFIEKRKNKNDQNS